MDIPGGFSSQNSFGKLSTTRNISIGLNFISYMELLVYNISKWYLHS